MMELFCKETLQILQVIFPKKLYHDVWQGSKYGKKYSRVDQVHFADGNL